MKFELPAILGIIAGSVPAVQGAAITATIYVGRHFEVRDHDQPTKYLFNGQTRVAEVTGSLSGRPRIQRLRLYPGWNLCSLAVSGPFPAGGAEAIAAAYQWNPTIAAYSLVTLGQNLAAGTVIWLQAGTNAVVSVVGSYTDPIALSLQAGADYLPGAGLEAWAPALAGSASIWQFDPARPGWSAHLAGSLAAASSPPPNISPGEAFYLETATSGVTEIPDPALRIRYYHQDHLGSSSAIADATGSLVEETAFYPFGVPRSDYQPRQVHEPYQFTQKERDAENGLHYFEARYLAAARARFLSADPAYASPDHLPAQKYGAFTQQPQLLNLYSYALSSPLRFHDPTGLEIEKLNWIQTIRVNVARQQALDMLDYSIYKVEQNKYACAPSNPADDFLEAWFGLNGGLGNKEQVAADLRKIRTQLASLKSSNFRYNSAPTGKLAGAIAYVYPNDATTVYVTDKFFALKNFGVDSQGGTLIHENSHPKSVLGTDDIAYGPTDSGDLAKEDRGRALKNADNWEYFNEGLAIDQQLRSQKAQDEATRYLTDLANGTCSK